MSRKRTQPAPLASISRSNLEHVVGGRLAVSKGPDTGVVQGIKGLTEGVAALQQKFAADQAGQQQQMGQLMQQMQGRRG